MPQASAFDRHFSAADKAKLAALVDSNPHLTVDDWRALLAERGLDISRSAAHREKGKLERLGERLRRTRQMRQALVERIGDQDDSEQMRGLIEMVSALGFEFAEAQFDGEGGDLDSKQLVELARMTDALSSASRRNQQFADAIRRQALEDAAEAVERTARTRAVPADVAAALRQALSEV